MTFGQRADEPIPAGRGRLGSTTSYLAALAITVAAILSQYVVPEDLAFTRPLYENLAGALFVTYGIPILAFVVLVGLRPLDRWSDGTIASFAPAIGWFGALSVLSLGIIVVLAIVYEILDPSALQLLQRSNPVLVGASSDPWFWIAFSFVIGAVEEAIFRGWIFGYWIAKGSTNLGWHAVWTSALFAAMHLYYGATYLAAAPFSYVELFLTGLAFSLAVRGSRGNLVWVALLHGATDAIAFSSILSQSWAEGLHFGLIFAGFAVAVILYLRSLDRPAAPTPVGPMPPLPNWASFEPLGPGGAGSVPRAVSVVPPPAGPAPPPPPPPPGPPPPE